jgi:hypothetical protein
MNKVKAAETRDCVDRKWAARVFYVNWDWQVQLAFDERLKGTFKCRSIDATTALANIQM